MSSGSRVQIPGSLRKTIQNIKEIAGNHSEDEIYAMLKECSMDPNETAQKLLFQDTFHEVKRKRDRRKENLSNKEAAESRLRPGMQGRGSRGGRGNFSARYVSNEVSGGKRSAPGKENGINQVPEKVVEISSLPTSQESNNKEVAPYMSSQIVISNGPTAVAPGSGVVHAAHSSAGSLVNKSEDSSAVDVSNLGSLPTLPYPVRAIEKASVDFGTGDTHWQLTSSSSNTSIAGTQSPSPGVYFSASDPVLEPSHDSRLPGAVGAIKREVGSQRTPAEQISLVPSEGKSIDVSDVGSSSAQGMVATKSLVVVPSIHGGSAANRPSPNYNSRSQQVIGPQKAAGPSKEWKPKPPNPILAQGSGTDGASEVPITAEANIPSHPASSVLDSKVASSKLQRKLEELHVSDGQHVIIPNHLHVPETAKLGFCFGSFDASFGLSSGHNNGSENVGKATTLSETSESVEEAAEQFSSNLNALSTTVEGDYPDHPQSPRHVPQNLLSGEGNVSSTVVPEYSESKKDTSFPLESHQYSMVHTSPSYNFGFMPPIVSSQIAPFEGSESQARDVSRLPSFVVPQPFDPASYYAQFYRPGTDSDGRISPFHSPGVTMKYNGNVPVLPQQTSQSVQEGGNSVVLSTAGPTLLTQAAGVMQSSIPVPQQPLPMFRQPTGMPIAHYPPSYFPYGHYFSPYYVPPPAIHQFLSNGVLPQQPQAGSVFPVPPGHAGKYSLSQYKAGTNTANSSSNEDLTAPQFKDSSVYVTGQQSEGSSVWMTAPSRDISGLQPSSFYNIPPQGQVTFSPTQSFAGIYHPAQAVSATAVHPLLQQSQTLAAASDILGPQASVYQQPQHTQINWPNNY